VLCYIIVVLLYHVMLCDAMLCYIMLGHVMLCYLLLLLLLLLLLSFVYIKMGMISFLMDPSSGGLGITQHSTTKYLPTSYHNIT